MLDSYQFETKVTPVTRVIEKSITPDKVTDMYLDVKKEFESSISQTLRVSDNYFSGIAIESVNYGFRTIVTNFTINGKKYTASFPCELLEDMYRSPGEMYEKLKAHFCSEVGKLLAKEVTIRQANLSGKAWVAELVEKF